MEKYKTREDVPVKYKWDLSDIFKSKEEFIKEIELLNKSIKKLEDFSGCTKDVNKFLKYIKSDIEFSEKITNLYIYARLISDQDLSISENVLNFGKILNLDTEYMLKTSFFEPELLSLNEKEYNDLFKNEELKKYKKYFDEKYKYKNHVLSKEEEELVSRLLNASEDYEQISSTLLNSNHDYGDIVLSDGSNEKIMTTNYRSLMKKETREKRKEIYLKFNEVKDRYASTNAALLNGYVKTNVELAKIRKYKSTWDEKLFGLKMNDKIFTTLVNSAIKRKDSLKKYSSLRKKVLKLDKLYPWDTPVDLFKIDKEYSIEEAQNIILDSLNILGTDYINHFKKIFEDRCVDYCQYKNKCSGGYNMSSSSIKNSKILMSYNYNLESISTLIHEGGHHVNHQYVFENNDLIYRDIPLMLAEVASLTNEFLLSYKLIDKGTKEEKLEGLSNIISVFENNFFGAIQEGDMEREFYKYVEDGGVLTKDYLYNLQEKSIKKFYPKEKLDNEYEKTGWITRSHYYAFYYLFSYALCVSVASYVAKEIYYGNEKVLNNYIEFLKSGSSIDILDRFKILGIDLNDESVYLKSIDNFESFIDKFDEIYSS